MWVTWLMPSIKSRSKDKGVPWSWWLSLPHQSKMGREKKQAEYFQPQHLKPLLNVSYR